MKRLSVQHRCWSLAAAVTCAGCCITEVQYRSAAPDSSQVAVLFIRECGAMGDADYQVSVVKRSPGTRLWHANAVDFGLADSAPAGAVRQVFLTWLDPKRLLVEYDTSTTRVAYQVADTVAGVQIIVRKGISPGHRPIPVR